MTAAARTVSGAAIAASHCPLCGQANQCAVAAGLPPEQCWCMTTPISPDALAQVPPAQRGQVCICPACGQMPPLADGTAPVSSSVASAVLKPER